MPPKKKGQKREDWMVDFLDWRLTADEKKAFDAFYEKKSSELLGMLAGLMQSKYKVSFSYDENNNSYLCTLTPREEKDPNYGWAMTSRSHDPYRALAISLYKHFNLCDDQEWPTEMYGGLNLEG